MRITYIFVFSMLVQVVGLHSAAPQCSQKTFKGLPFVATILLGCGIAALLWKFDTVRKYGCESLHGDMTDSCWRITIDGNTWNKLFIYRPHCPFNRSITAEGIKLSPEVQKLFKYNPGSFTCLQKVDCFLIREQCLPKKP